ncbi:hypothetical protein GGR56DRAFT_670090 [Xylariaceae sp. FL0804]|nr:hypothetical protein GGR56DRAFT_670090 [Xylariaceae sp. FL0804]
MADGRTPILVNKNARPIADLHGEACLSRPARGRPSSAVSPLDHARNLMRDVADPRPTEVPTERHREQQQQGGVSTTNPTAAEEGNGTREPRSSPVPGNGCASSPSTDSIEANEDMSPVSLCKRLSHLEQIDV